MRVITDIETWFLDHDSRIFRFLVYKKMFTPHEQKMAYMDESEYVSNRYTIAKLHEAIDLGSGNWLLGFWINFDDPENTDKIIEYHRFDDIKLSYFEYDEVYSEINDDGELE